MSQYQEGDASWSLSVLIGLPLLIIGIGLLLWAAFWLRNYARAHPENYDIDIPKWAARVLFVVSGVAILLTLVGYYPWKAEYHQFVTKKGTVEKISSRILGSSDSFQQKFVVQFRDGRRFGCEDTRCSLIRPGDELALACKRTWQYAGTDGYDCKWVASSRT